LDKRDATMLDLLKIPGIWLRPEIPEENTWIPQIRRNSWTPGSPPCQVILCTNGEADWQYSNLKWSSSGHWKIVKGVYISIVEINPDFVNDPRGDFQTERYFKLISVNESQLTIAEPLKKPEPQMVWQKVATAPR
jgi:hypothetical protein